MTNVHWRTSNGLIRVKGHTRRPIRSNTAAHILLSCPMIATHAPTSPIVWTGTIKTWSQLSLECMKRVLRASSPKREGGRRETAGWRDGDGEEWKRKERSKANGFMVTVIIRLAENHFISHRAEGMLGNGLKRVFSVQRLRCSQMCLFLFVYAAVFLYWTWKGEVEGWVDRMWFIIDNCGRICVFKAILWDFLPSNTCTPALSNFILTHYSVCSLVF